MKETVLEDLLSRVRLDQITGILTWQDFSQTYYNPVALNLIRERKLPECWSIDTSSSERIFIYKNWDSRGYYIDKDTQEIIKRFIKLGVFPLTHRYSLYLIR